ncbi:MAG: hypothetical protein HQ542_03090 [Bacteroidia bacterium]|nr:hypothetical protein [Bacteroidia bacterium]
MLKQHKRLVIGILFFMIASLSNFFSGIRFDLFPLQEVNLSGGIDLVPGFL